MLKFLLLLINFAIFLPNLSFGWTNYLDITGVITCDQIPYAGATVKAVDKGNVSKSV